MVAITAGLAAAQVPATAVTLGLIPAVPDSQHAAALGPLLSAPVHVGQSTPVPRATRPDLTRWSLAFEPVRDTGASAGSVGSGIDYFARAGGYSVFVGSGGAILALPQWPRTVVAAAVENLGLDRRHGGRRRPAAATGCRWLRVRFEGASVDCAPQPEGVLPGVVNRLRGSDPARWQRHLPTHSRIRYDEVYPGIDILFHGSGRQLEYDVIVRPGAHPDLPRLRFDGTRSTTVAADGALHLEMEGGAVVQPRPVAYQEGREGRERVEVAYAQRADGTIGFAVGPYDISRPLVIDPVLSYATLLGAAGFDQCWDIAPTTDGAAIVVGETEGPDLTAARLLSTNAFLTNFQGGLAGVAGDAFVARLNPEGTAFEWFTYLGGSDLDGAVTLGLGAGDEPVIGGFTTSTNFPLTAGAFQQGLQGDTNIYSGRVSLEGFIARLTADGSGVVAATLFGGENEDQVLDLAVLPDGRVVAVGSTASEALPIPGTAAQSKLGGGVDGFMAVFSADLSTLTAGTYLGGENHDSAEGVVVDGAETAHVVGITLSTNFPVAFPLQATNAGFADGFAAGVRVADATLVYSTYFGGEFDDDAYRVALGAVGGPWVVGETRSTDFPVINSLQGTNAGIADGFIVHLTANGRTLESSTYFGGESLDAIWDAAVDPSGNLHIVGGTFSETLPGLGVDSLNSTNLGGSDAFAARIATNGTVISTFYGSSAEEIAYGVATDPAGNAYVAGRTRSPEFPVASTNVAQAVYGGGTADGFLLKVTYEPALEATLAADGVVVSWPAPNPAFVLESCSGLGSGEAWLPVDAPAAIEENRYRVRLPAAATNSVFRLRWVR